MEKEIRSTIYLSEDLYKRFREACNKKFGDKQGKIKQGYIVAITDFTNSILQTPQDIVADSTSTPEPPAISAKKLEEARLKEEAEASVALDHDPNLQTISEPNELDQDEDSIEAKAKKLADERRKQEKQEEQSDHKVLT